MAEALELDFDRMTPQGMASASLPGGRAAAVWGVLPGERVRVAPIRRRHGVLLCRLEGILTPSPDRIAPREPHYLSCSPWQVMTYAAQTREKRAILQSLFPEIPLDRFVEADTRWGYRTKLEFSFTEEQGRLELAFHERSSPFRKMALPDGCALAGAQMNAAAKEVVDRLRERGIRAQALKSLIVRASAATGEALAALYVMQEDLDPGDFRLERSAGFALIYSDPLSPASVSTAVLRREGAACLTERVAGLALDYPLDGFFQNHVEMFAAALEAIRHYMPDAARLVELYSGVGSIGLALADRAQEIVAVESNDAAVEFAAENALRNGVRNYHARAGRAESCSEELLAGADVVVADPPRTGFDAKTIAALARSGARRILYLSCHPAKQARDVAMLGSAYRPVAFVGFDFYPQTPHIESLVVLDRKAR